MECWGFPSINWQIGKNFIAFCEKFELYVTRKVSDNRCAKFFFNTRRNEVSIENVEVPFLIAYLILSPRDRRKRRFSTEDTLTSCYHNYLNSAKHRARSRARRRNYIHNWMCNRFLRAAQSCTNLRKLWPSHAAACLYLIVRRGAAIILIFPERSGADYESLESASQRKTPFLLTRNVVILFVWLTKFVLWKVRFVTLIL